MTNSQKAFEEWCKSKRISEHSLAHEAYLHVWQAAWEERGLFDEEVCSKFEQEVWLKYKSENLLDSYHEGMSDGAGCCVVEIRKRGGE